MGRGHQYRHVKHAFQGITALLLSLQGRHAAAQPPEPAGRLTPQPVVDVVPTYKGEQLEKDLQNPLAMRVTIPVQYTMNFEYGPEERTQHQVNLQPIYPF